MICTPPATWAGIVRKLGELGTRVAVIVGEARTDADRAALDRTLKAAKPFVLRIFRLMRILRLIKLGRMSLAMNYLIEAITARRVELLLSFFVGLFFLILSASALYVVEGEVQPDKFGSIPRTLWWAAVTLTTIGYGDVYPVTPLGKVFAGLVAFAGIGLIALPTGILAAAFSEAVQAERGDA